MTCSVGELEGTGYIRTGKDNYNFPLEIMVGNDDLIELLSVCEKTKDECFSGASLLVTDKQYVMTYNRGRGYGSHMNAIGRIWANIKGVGALDKTSMVAMYNEAESKALCAKIYSERMRTYGPIENRIVITTRPDKRITQEEYNSFISFCVEYGHFIDSHKFHVSVGKRDLPNLEAAKLYLESMVDPDLDLSEIMPENQRIIGKQTNEIRAFGGR